MAERDDAIAYLRSLDTDEVLKLTTEVLIGQPGDDPDSKRAAGKSTARRGTVAEVMERRRKARA